MKVMSSVLTAALAFSPVTYAYDSYPQGDDLGVNVPYDESSVTLGDAYNEADISDAKLNEALDRIRAARDQENSDVLRTTAKRIGQGLGWAGAALTTTAVISRASNSAGFDRFLAKPFGFIQRLYATNAREAAATAADNATRGSATAAGTPGATSAPGDEHAKGQPTETVVTSEPVVVHEPTASAPGLATERAAEDLERVAKAEGATVAEGAAKAAKGAAEVKQGVAAAETAAEITERELAEAGLVTGATRALAVAAVASTIGFALLLAFSDSPNAAAVYLSPRTPLGRKLRDGESNAAIIRATHENADGRQLARSIVLIAGLLENPSASY